jgi:hypothetical protein
MPLPAHFLKVSAHAPPHAVLRDAGVPAAGAASIGVNAPASGVLELSVAAPESGGASRGPPIARGMGSAGEVGGPVGVVLGPPSSGVMRGGAESGVALTSGAMGLPVAPGVGGVLRPGVSTGGMETSRGPLEEGGPMVSGC